MEFETFNHSILTKKTQVDLKAILNMPIVDLALSNGGYLAGGFVRSALCGDDVIDYLIPENDSHFSINGKRPGDLDIFFENPESVAICSEMLKESASSDVNDFRSLGGFAFEGNIRASNIGNIRDNYRKYIKVQLVDHNSSCGKQMLQNVGNFDFTNCAVAMTKDKIFVPRNWREVEKDNLLDVVSSASPFLGSRILKYIHTRGMVGLTERSRDTIVEWIVRSLYGKFEGYTKMHTSSVVSNLKKMATDVRLIPTNDLVMFLGVWKETIKQSGAYGKTYEVDFAMNEIARRNNV